MNDFGSINRVGDACHSFTIVSLVNATMQVTRPHCGPVRLGLQFKRHELSWMRWICVGEPSEWPCHWRHFIIPNVLFKINMLLLRTAIYMILCLLPFGLVLMGPDCSSWTSISRGTSRRTVLNPWGNLELEWVRCANLTISRLLASTIKCEVRFKVTCRTYQLKYHIITFYLIILDMV